MYTHTHTYIFQMQQMAYLRQKPDFLVTEARGHKKSLQRRYAYVCAYDVYMCVCIYIYLYIYTHTTRTYIHYKNIHTCTHISQTVLAHM